VIVRRRGDGESRDLAPVGVPLPPANGKHRVALSLPPKAVSARRPPPPLAEASESAPVSWRATLGALVGLGARHGCEARVFGSLLWQHVTGLTYVTDSSDLDVLWSIDRLDEVPALLDGIARAEESAAFRIDGEIAFADGAAVNWRELHRAATKGPNAMVLAKHMDGIGLRQIGSLLADRPCP
jgi:phosphoribosyl-dephospho-CoA transferase